jgi:hypothetical protein
MNATPKSKKEKEIFTMDNSTVMVIAFPDGGEETARKMQAVLRFVNEGYGFVDKPDKDIDPANIRFRFADDEGEQLPPY